MKVKKKILHELYVELVKLQKEVISSNLKLLVYWKAGMLPEKTESYKESSNTLALGKLK